MKKLKICKACRVYSLESLCKRCGGPTFSPHPARFSPQDKFGRYRRMIKDRRRGEA